MSSSLPQVGISCAAPPFASLRLVLCLLLTPKPPTPKEITNKSESYKKVGIKIDRSIGKENLPIVTMLKFQSLMLCISIDLTHSKKISMTKNHEIEKEKVNDKSIS